MSHHDDDLPEWARITSDLVDDAPESPEPASPAAPPTPVPAAVPAPVAPVPVSTAPPVPVPVPVPTPAPPAPARPAVPVPAPESPAPASPAGPARRLPTYESPLETDDEPFEPDPEPAIEQDRHREPAPSAPEPKKDRSRRRGGWKTVASSPAPTRTGDGRRKVVLMRIAVWAVMSLVALAGLRAIVAPPRTDVSGVLAAAEANYGLTTFPLAEAEGVALGFAGDYLTYTPTSSDARYQRLLKYVTPNLYDEGWLRSDGKGTQAVVQGPLLATQPKIDDLQHATFTVAAAVRDPNARLDGQPVNPAWVYLSVPIYWADNGGLGVAGPPAFVPAPVSPDSGGGFSYPTDDQAAAAARPDMQNFFRAWGASSEADLARYVPEKATPQAKAGLGGTVALQEVGIILMQAVENPTDERFAQVNVTWTYRGSVLKQGYRLTVYQDNEGRWYVTDIAGGDFV